MAKVTLNQLLDAIRGGIGGLVFRKRPDGTLIISGAPRYEKRKATQKQKAYRAHFKQGTAWAKWADDEYPVYKTLAAEAKAAGAWDSPYNFALADFLKPPVIHAIESTDGCIRVHATDNVMVTKVHVSVLDGDGRILEKGNAVRADGDWWQFSSQMEGKSIFAEAWDLPGNVTKFVL